MVSILELQMLVNQRFAEKSGLPERQLSHTRVKRHRAYRDNLQLSEPIPIRAPLNRYKNSN